MEAIAFGSAAAEDKLSKEFLSARGIRVTDPIWMRSGFTNKAKEENITIDFEQYDGNYFEYDLVNDNKVYSKWKDISIDETLFGVQQNISRVLDGNSSLLNEMSLEGDEKEIRIIDNFPIK